MNWLLRRLHSLRHALRGIATLLREQPNAQLHLLATGLVFGVGYSLGLSRADWQSLVLTVSLVWLAEGLNTALEYLCDAAVPESHPLIRKAKDVAAGSVLICSGFAIFMAALIFLPYLLPA